MLTVVDGYTRECLAIEVDSCLSSRRVTRVLDRVIQQRGTPEAVRCDNGPEFTSRHFLAWCEDRRIALTHIQPGRPIQNGWIESFNGRFRDECLNASLRLWLDARQKIETGREEGRNDGGRSGPSDERLEALSAGVCKKCAGSGAELAPSARFVDLHAA